MRPISGGVTGMLRWRAALIVTNTDSTPGIDLAVDNGDYLWYAGGALDVSLIEHSAGTFGPRVTRHITFDIRSQRKFRTQQSKLWFILLNSDAALSLTMAFSCRFLYKLP